MFGSGLPTNASLPTPAEAELLVVAAAIVNGDRILAAKRLAGGAASEKWEFPGGKVEAGESPERALERELLEELGLHIEVGPELGTFRVSQPQRRIALQCHWCSIVSGDLQLSAHSEVRWLTTDELPALDWALPDVPAVQLILELTARIGLDAARHLEPQ
ncbi:MAG: NUDIX domain-containing protein [Burkholderiaceae bacterium]|nr:NUDIX domain-containing protein [Burkholderiaceae bacterium]